MLGLGKGNHMSERRASLLTESPVQRSVEYSGRVGYLRWIGITALVLASTGAGYLGSELHRYFNPTWTETKESPEELDHRKILVDIGDRYQLTNQRINDQWKVIVYLDTNDKLQSERIAEMRGLMGLDKPRPTPRPRPTVSERLKPAPTKTPTP